MFFYLVNNSNLFNKSVSKNDKYIKLLIYGTVAYIVLHAILFVGGKEALFYNFRYYFWIILALDIAVLLATDINNTDSPLNKLFKSDTDEIKNEYRVDIKRASINDIMEGAEIEQQNENNKVVERPTTPTKNNNTESQSESRGNQAQKKKKKKRKVTFDLSGGSSVNSDFNKFAQPISNPNQINADSILSSNRNINKSTPLDTLLRDRASNPNDFVSGVGDVDGYQSFSDSESEYNSDLDMDSFEKGLTM